MNRQLKKLTLGLFAAVMLISSGAQAEVSRPTTNNIYNWLLNMGKIGHDSSGGFYLPTAVYSGISSGKFSALSQILITTHTMASCVKETIRAKYVPQRRTPYVEAAEMFEEGLCRLANCFQQAFSMVMLSEVDRQLKQADLSADEEKRIKQNLAISMLNAFNKNNERCGGNGQGFDQMMFVILGGVPQSVFGR